LPEVIALPAGTRVWLVAGVTDMRCGFQGLAAKVQTALEENPLGGVSGGVEALKDGGARLSETINNKGAPRAPL